MTSVRKSDIIWVSESYLDSLFSYNSENINRRSDKLVWDGDPRNTKSGVCAYFR